MMTHDGPSDIGVREAGTAHAGVLARLHEACFSGEERWNAAAFARLTSMPGVRAFVAFRKARGEAEAAARPIGLVVVRGAVDEAEIVTLGVCPEARREGVGARLLRSAMTAARDCGAAALHLEVAEDNVAGQALYRAAGFVETGRRKGYYRRSDGSAVDARILSRPLGGENTV
jgi:ribosomal-protein-alanine N-acetyltransferase